MQPEATGVWGRKDPWGLLGLVHRHLSSKMFKRSHRALRAGSHEESLGF